LRLPGRMTARKRPSGEIVNSRMEMPCRMGRGVGWRTGMSTPDF